MVQNGYLDGVAVERVKDYQARLTEFLSISKVGLLQDISRQKALTDALTAELKAAAEQFEQLWT
jgi:F-type H+-transporting ATPase subunit alpha